MSNNKCIYISIILVLIFLAQGETTLAVRLSVSISSKVVQKGFVRVLILIFGLIYISMS